MDERISLLIVEDSKVDAFLLIRELQTAGFEVVSERVQTAEELQAALGRGSWDAVLSDYNLPSFSAPEALEIVRQSGLDLPFIIVSGAIGEETAIEMMRAGAHDYLMKDNLSRLAEALRREIREVHVRQERRLAEAAQKASEERFRLLFERSKDAIFLVDTRNGRYLDANQAAEVLTGRPIADLKMLSTSDTTPAGAQNRLARIGPITSAVDFGEVVYVRPNGSHRVALLTAIPVSENLVFGIAQDVTEKKQAEEELHSTKAFLDHVLKAVPLGISVFNVKTRKMEFANEINNNLSGLTLAQFNSASAATLMEMVHPDDRQRRADFIKSLVTLADGECREIEYRRLNAQKDLSWFHYRYFVFERDSDGSVCKLLSVVEDITERKHAEEALSQSMLELQDAHQRLRFNLDRMPLAFVVLSRDLIITEWNPAAETIFGWTSAEAIGQHDFLIVPPDVQPQVSQVWVSLTENEQSGYSLNENITKDGRRIICEWHNAYLRDAEGNTIGLLCMCNDVTERQRAEQAQERQLKELSLLHNLALAGIRINSLDELVGYVTSQVGRSFELENFGVLFLDEKTQHLRLHPSFHSLAETNPEFIPLETSITGRVVVTGKPYRVGNVDTDRYYLAISSKVRSELCVPIKIGEKILGVIDAESQYPDYFTEDDERLLMTIAGQMATVIERLRLFEGLQASLKELNQAYESTIEGWSRAMDLRDKDTENHTLRVTELTIRLAQAMGIRPDELVHIRRGALLHDIGKIGVPDSILLKPDNLTPEEWKIMRMHPQYAYDMISAIAHLLPALDIPYCHHEHWDGTGYPRGLKGEAIPLAARIFAVVDVWDALTSDRPYRAAWSHAKTLEYLHGLAGKEFDPRVVAEFLKLMG